ncbi:MFS transporter [Candidatus Leptofilum sp.]|uniref:MFS transporter n=1 Tax=Candidatus Leptofilum sp. TaxID=3241576 RepID=UPI003B5B431D
MQKFRAVVPWQRTLAIMFVAQLLTAVGFSVIFPFLSLYVTELGSQSGLSVEFLAGAVFSAQALTMMIASPFWGAVADRYGRKLMVQRAMFGGAIIMLMMGFVRSGEELVLLRALQGMVTGTVAAANALIASVAPRQRSGYAMGLLLMGQSTGIAIGPLIGGVLADAFGYRLTFVLTSVLLLMGGVLVFWGVEERFSPRAQSAKARPSFWAAWRHVFQTDGVILAYALRFLANLGRTLLTPFAPLFIATLLIDSHRLNTVTGLVIAVSAGAGTITAVYLGRLGDKIGHGRVLKWSALAAGLLFLPQSLVTAAWQLLILQALTGAAAGGIIPAISALLARYTQPGEEGSVYGIDNSIVAASRAAAPLVGSAIAFWFDLRATFAATAVVFLLVALLSFLRLPSADPDPLPNLGD